MKNKQNVKFIFMTMLFLSIILLSSKVHAASLSISPSKNSATVGESVNVTIFGDDIQGNVSVSASGADLNVSSVYINNNSATITATITNSGTVTVSAKATEIDVISQEGTKFSDEKSCSLTVAENTPTQSDPPSQETQNDDNSQNQDNKEEKKSSDANLANLGIRPHDFTGFNPGQLSYDAEVPNDTEEVEVYAKLKDSKAKVQGTGAKKLKVGKNALDVVVTAEDGTKKTYTINVTRLEAEEEENTTEEQVAEENPVETESVSNLTKLEVEGFNISPTFSPDIYEYTLTVNKDVTQLNVITEGANDNIKIEVVGNTELQEGENIVTILVQNEENEQTDTYQIIVTKNNEEIVAATAPVNEQMQKARKIRYIILGAFIFIIVCIVAIVLLRKKFGKNENYFGDFDDSDDEYYDNNKSKINLSDDDELFNRVNKNDFYKKDTITPYINRKSYVDFETEKKDEMVENDIKELKRRREQNSQYEDAKIALRRDRQIKKDVHSELEQFNKTRPKKLDFEKNLRDDFTVQSTKQNNFELKEKNNKREEFKNKSSDLDNFYAMDNLEEFLRAQKDKNRK